MRGTSGPSGTSGAAENGGPERTKSPSLSSISDSSLLSISVTPSKSKNLKARFWVPSTFTMLLGVVFVLLTISLGRVSSLEQRHATATVNSGSTKVPDYFQTSPELFAGECPSSLVPIISQI